MKKISKLFFLPLAAMMVTGCRDKNKAPETPETPEEQEQEQQVEASISLDKLSLALKVGESANLVATAANGEGAVTWTSSDATKVTVDQQGHISGVAQGTAIITATYSGKTATCFVAVFPEDAKIVRSISLNPTSLTLNTVSKLTGTITPVVDADEGAETTVSWLSNNNSVVTVTPASGAKDAAVTVNVVGKGTAEITATCGGLFAKCTVEVLGLEGTYVLTGVSMNPNVNDFLLNVQDSEDEFRGETSSVLEVGDDNAFDMKPTLTVKNLDNGQNAPEEAWGFDYEYELKVKQDAEYIDASSSYIEHFDAAHCKFDFAESAIGKQFKLTVLPGGLTAAQKEKAEYRNTVELVVRNGYNVYSENELAYANDIGFLLSDRQGDIDYNEPWKTFRSAHGLSTSYVAPAIYLQKNMVLTGSHLPAEMFWTAAEAVGHEEWVGLMKDETDVYAHYATDYTFNGNYFDINTEAVPVAVDNAGYDDNVSHCTLFKVAENRVGDPAHKQTSHVYFKNASYFGNGKRGNDTTPSMGLIFFKVRNCQYRNGFVIEGTFDNFNVEAAVISFYAEKGETTLIIKDCLVQEGYSNGLYLWNNGDVTFENSKLAHFGGPVILTDGSNDVVYTDPDTGDQEYKTVSGFHIVADDATEFINPITGDEPWFMHTKGGAPHAKMGDITALNGVVNMRSVVGAAPTRTFLTGENQEMNMIVLNYGDVPHMSFKKANNGRLGFDRESPIPGAISPYIEGGAPLLSTDAGASYLYTGNNSDYGSDFAEGDYLDLFVKVAGFGYLSLIFELYNI